MPEEDFADCSVPYVLINENTPIPPEGISFKIDDLPNKHRLDSVMAVFEGAKVKADITVGEQQDCHILTSTKLGQYGFTEPGKVKGILTAERGNVLLHCFVVYFTDMNAMPPVLDEKCIINNPEQGMNIGVRLGRVFELSSGWDEVVEIHAELKHPDGKVDTIRGSSTNYIWRGKSLHMRLPMATTCHVRVCYKIVDGNWLKWSNWLPLTPRRKMSL